MMTAEEFANKYNGCKVRTTNNHPGVISTHHKPRMDIGIVCFFKVNDFVWVKFSDEEVWGYYPHELELVLEFDNKPLPLPG